MPVRKAFRRRFYRDERGTMAIMGAILVATLAGALAIGVDGASLFVEKRKSQGAVDLAAIAAARDIPRAHAAALATVSDNGVRGVEQLVITTGNYTADPALAPHQRFRPNATPLNAARVEMRNRAPLYFARAFLDQDTMEIETQATAVASASAAFSVGSRLLSLNEGILNAVLGRLLGGKISLTAMDYNALAGLQIDLFRFSDALSTRIGAQIGTYEELAATNPSLRHVIDALLDIAHSAGTGAAVSALQQIGNGTNPGAANLPAGQLLDFGLHGRSAIGEGGAAFSARASALSILATAAQIANGSRQVEVMTSLSLPGLLGLDVGILIGERPQRSPWIAMGEKDVSVYTAQTRVRLIAEVGGTGVLSAARIRLPIHVHLAGAEARLAHVSCGPDPAQDAQVAIDVRPSAVSAWIGEPATSWTSFTTKPRMNPAQLVNVANLVTAHGAAEVEISNLRDEQAVFGWTEIAKLQPKTVRTADFTSSLVSSLVANTNLSVKAGPLTLLSPAALGKLVLSSLLPVTAVLDGVLNDLLGVLGIGLGEADVWVHGVRCDGAVLVN